MSPLESLLAELDARFERRHGVRCQSRFGWEVAVGSGPARLRARKRADGSYELARGDQPLPALDPDHCTKHEVEQLRTLLRQLQEEDRITVQLGKVTVELRLFARASGQAQWYFELPSFHVSVGTVRAGDTALALDPRLERPLSRYLGLLRDRDASLASLLGAVNRWVPAEIRDLDLLWDNVFAGGGASMQRECRLNLCLTCNQRCLFCCAAGEQSLYPLERLTEALDGLAARLGTSTAQVVISFTGGEPTLHPDLPRLIDQARAAGFCHFILQTNGTRLERGELTRALFEAGVGQLILSLHSHRPEIYDQLTGTRGQLPRVLRGIAQLARHPFLVLSYNQVICRLNYRDLPDYVDFLGSQPRHGQTRVAFIPSTVYMDVDNGRWADVAVRHSDVVPALADALARAPDLFHPMVGDCAMPICVVRDYPALVRLAPAVGMTSATAYLESRDPADVPRRHRIKHSDCRRCVHEDRCGGVCGEYARTFGLGELVPIEV